MKFLFDSTAYYIASFVFMIFGLLIFFGLMSPFGLREVSFIALLAFSIGCSAISRHKRD